MALGYSAIGGVAGGSTTFVVGGGDTSVKAVKEIGFLQRAEGLSSGLVELHERLQRLSAKINGHPVGAGDNAKMSVPSGLDGALTAAEGALRACFDAISQIDGQF